MGGMGKKYPSNSEGYRKLAREFRRRLTPTERIFWEQVRAHRFCGLKFRRQHRIGRYFVDFYCHELKLVIEVDGGIHQTSKGEDALRTKMLHLRGLLVWRVPNERLYPDPTVFMERFRDWYQAVGILRRG